MANSDEQHFCLTIDYDRQSAHPEEVFLGIANLIKSFNTLDNSLVACIDNQIEPVLILEDVEKGSIKMILKNIIESIPDDGLRECNVKKILGAYLVKCKYLILKYVDDKDSINTSDVETLENNLMEVAKQTNISSLNCYDKPPRDNFLKGVAEMGNAVGTFRKNDKIYMEIPGEQKVIINTKFRLPQKDLEEFCAGKELKSTATIILKVRKPDFLGDTQWMFKHGENNFDAKFLDTDWLDKYRHREVAVYPGDSLKVKVEFICVYDKNGVLLSQKNSILRVYSIIPGNCEISLIE